MNDKLYIKKLIRDDGQTFSFDGEEIYLAQDNTLLVRPDPNTTAVNYTEADGGEMIGQQNTIYDQPINGLIVPKSTDYWTLTSQLSLFFQIKHTYKIVYIKKDGTMFASSGAWISAGLQIVPVPHEEYSRWNITMSIGDTAWTEYAEDDSGKEIYSNTITLPLLSSATGGEEWEYEEQEEVSEEGTEITFNDTVDGAKITDLTLKGDTYQQTYSGKNLLPPPEDFTQDVNGLTITCSNGEYIFSGNASSGSSTGLKSIIDQYTIQEGDYYHYNNSLVSPRINIALRFSDNTLFASSMNVKNRIASLADYVGKTVVGITVNFNSGYDFEGGANPMIVNGVSTVTPFEPYVGGTASPNPDYPQDIDVVTGEQTIWVSGKNIFNGELELGIISGSTGKTSSNNNYVRSKDFIPVEEATAYTISAPDSSITPIFIYEYTADFSYNLTNNRSLANGGSFTTNSGTKYVKFRPGVQSADTSMKFQLEKGTVATSYYPYLAKSYEVNLGKNLMPMSTASVSDSKRINNFNIDLPAGTYTVSFNIDSFSLGTNTTFGINMGLYNSSGMVIYDKPIFTISSSTAPGRRTYTFTIDDSASASVNSNIRVGQTLYDNGARVELSDIQIEAGERDTVYAPYFTPIELCKIGTYQDYIYKSGDDWYVHKEIGKVLFDGSSDENWLISNTGTDNFFYAMRNINGFHYTGLDSGFLCSAGVPVNIGSTNTVEGASITNTGEFRLRYGTEMTLTNWKTYLSNTPMSVYYQLATPTDTKITDNTLIGELEALYAAQGYNDKTIITVSATSTNLPAILAVTLQNPPITGEVWDEVGTVWELGSGGAQTININSTRAIYPLWVVEGPCVNPKLQNNTTDTLAEFDGTVAEGQTLTVDFAAGTAYLNSALVTRLVSGMVSLAPGENVVGFNSDGGATETSTISWNNIVN